MSTLSVTSKQLWPVWMIGGCILLTLIDALPQLLSAPSPPGLLGAAVVLIIAAAFSWPRLARNPRSLPLMLLLGGLATCGTTSWFLGLGESAAPLFGASGIALGLSLCVVLANGAQNSPVIQSEAPIVRELSAPRTEQTLMDEESLSSLAEEQCDENGQVLQSWTRLRLPDGTERLEGLVTVLFAADQRVQHFHVPFSPAFEQLPEGWCECDDDASQAEFNVLQTYGARLTVRRPAKDLQSSAVDVSIMLVSQGKRVSAA